MEKQAFKITVLAAVLAVGIALATAGIGTSSSGGIAPQDIQTIRMPPKQDGALPPDPGAANANASMAAEKAQTNAWKASEHAKNATQIVAHDPYLSDLLAN